MEDAVIEAWISDSSREVLESVPKRWTELRALMADLKEMTGRRACSLNPSLNALERKGLIERRCVRNSKGEFLCYEIRRSKL